MWGPHIFFWMKFPVLEKIVKLIYQIVKKNNTLAFKNHYPPRWFCITHILFPTLFPSGNPSGWVMIVFTPVTFMVVGGGVLGVVWLVVCWGWQGWWSEDWFRVSRWVGFGGGRRGGGGGCGVEVVIWVGFGVHGVLVRDVVGG